MDEILDDLILEGDHLLVLDEIMQLLNGEIQWCHKHPMRSLISEEYRKGFISGLGQAKTLILILARAGSKDAVDEIMARRQDSKEVE